MKPFISFSIYLLTFLNLRCTCGFSSALVKANKLNNEDATTEFPLNYQETETTTEGHSLNVTLDTRLVDDTHPEWRYSSLRIKKWFEYYNDTAHLTGLQSNETTCAHVIYETENHLEERNGIWATCQDPTLSVDCLSIPPCYPEINYRFSGPQLKLQTVKIYLSLQGLAVVRLTVGSSYVYEPMCFDYSRRKDPFSPCKHILLNSTNEWETVRSGFDGYDSVFFSSFTISLIARFKNDVALVDKIEATDFLLCSYAEGNCTTTSPGPTRSTPTTTPYPTPTDEATDVISSSTAKPTTKCPIKVTTKKLRILQVFMNSILNTWDDLTPIENEWGWEIVSPGWLEYYSDSNSLKDHSDNSSTCANMLPSSFYDLPDVVGIWGTCTDNSQSLNCSNRFNALCHPLIYYNAPEGHFVVSVKATFYFHNLAILRLHVGDECVDYSFEDTLSTCKYMKILQDGNYWRSFYWTSIMLSDYEKLAYFRLELISKSGTDVLLLDKVQVEYKQCNNDNCTSDPTTTTMVDPTTDFTTETEYYDCDEDEGTTITYTSTDEPPITTNNSVTVTTSSTSTSDNSESPGTSDTDSTTKASTTPKGTNSRSPHSMIPTMFALLVGTGITFFNWKY